MCSKVDFLNYLYKERGLNKLTEVITNEEVAPGVFRLTVAGQFTGKMGQFYMIRAWKNYPMLSRPISIFDADDKSLSFLYAVVGQGTTIFSELKPTDEITLQGPNGNSFPQVSGKIAMVGGGVGIAPFYLTAKQLKQANSANVVDAYLGFRETAILIEDYRRITDNVIVDVGGFITDKINPNDYDYIFACGPDPMMKAMFGKCKAAGAIEKLYLSIESRMGCGYGICAGCPIKIRSGDSHTMKKICSDGPVFRAQEVMLYE